MRTVICLLLSALAADAQRSASRDLVPVPLAEARAFDKSRKIALLVGVGKYPAYSGIGALQYPRRDVASLAEQLEAQGYLVIQLIDGEATRSAVRGALRNIKEVLNQQEGTLVFHFSGHGWAPAGRNFLASYDADASSLSDSGIALDEVLRLMAETGARRRVAWIDACRNEPGKSLPSARTFAAMEQSEGTRVLFSTRAGKQSFEASELQQGVFTHFLIRALKGEAARGDGLVTFRDVADYVTESVQAWSLRHGDLQIPYEAGEASGDFLIARANARAEPRLPEPPVERRAAGPQVGDVRTNPKDGLRYAWVPGGTFRVGCSEGDSECDPDERPARDVMITKGFWMGQTEVTVEAYKRFASATGRGMPDEPFGNRKLNAGWNNGSMPMVMADWNDAKGYCEWAGGRLPTEAEWERAARGGLASARYGPLRDVAWFGDNSGNQTLDAQRIWDSEQNEYWNRLVTNGNTFHAVGLKPSNAFSLYDMLGNVWEWTADWYGEKYYENGERRDPQGPPYGEHRVLRGGSWYGVTRDVRASNRDRFGPSVRSTVVGFRCAWE